MAVSEMEVRKNTLVKVVSDCLEVNWGIKISEIAPAVIIVERGIRKTVYPLKNILLSKEEESKLWKASIGRTLNLKEDPFVFYKNKEGVVSFSLRPLSNDWLIDSPRNMQDGEYLPKRKLPNNGVMNKFLRSYFLGSLTQDKFSPEEIYVIGKLSSKISKEKTTIYLIDFSPKSQVGEVEAFETGRFLKSISDNPGYMVLKGITLSAS